MVRQGFEVYLLDWGDWGPEDSGVSLDDLVLDYIPRTVRRTLRHAGQDRLTIMGYCIGGILTSMYAALHPDDPLRNVIVMAAPIEFTDAGLFTGWLNPRHFPLDKLLATYGNMPGVLVELGAKMLKPMTNFVTPYVNLFDRVEDDRYVRGWAAMYQWVHDRVDFPGAAFRQLVRDLYQENRLIRGELTLGGRQVDLSAIHWPFLLIAAERDHIAPLGSTLALFDAVKSAEKEKLVVPAGHVGLVAGRSAVNDLWPRVSGWLGPRSG
jgi:polyhydroxyalkanoate synthase